MRPVKRPLLRYLLITIGWISVVLGVLGIFLPVLPTTPFLLLAAACFVRSSPRFYQWLVEHPKLGRYILYYLEGKGIPKRAKWMAISMIWLTISLSALLVVPLFWVKVLLFSIAACVSLYILRQPTWEPSVEDARSSEPSQSDSSPGDSSHSA